MPMTEPKLSSSLLAAVPPLAPAAELAIEASGLTKTYGGRVRALDGLSFTVQKGTIFGLLGPNGAGKSTTIRILTTLSRPDAGSARVAGVDVLAQPAEVRRRIGCVAQKSGADRAATGRENLVLQGQIHGMARQDLARRVSELLERLGLTEAAGRMVSTYSGGMQRKLDIAMGLVHRPRVLFLDEPTTGLDPEARADLWDEIARLAAQEGITVLLTTHYLEEADRLAHRLAIVDRGRVVAEGTPEELKAELRGDALEIELTTADDAAVRRALEAAEDVSGIVLEGRRLLARAAQGATAVPRVLALLEGAGVGVASVKVSRPSLDDVYLRHAGRRFSEADHADAKGGAR